MEVLLEVLGEDFTFRKKLENLQKDSRTKMIDLQKILQLDVDLEKLITKPNEKGWNLILNFQCDYFQWFLDLKNFKLQREALKELENVKLMKKDLENKIDKQYKKMDVR